MKIKRIEKLEHTEDTGCITVKTNNHDHNFLLSIGIFVKNSGEGRGSDIQSVGGNAAGFTELNDIYYFSHKLYRALKYPLSRITQGIEQGQEVLFGGQGSGQISRDEIKWAKFLERHQRKFCNELVDLFLLHLDFRGLKKQYNLDKNSIAVRLTPPSHYKEQMQQGFLEQSFQNYNQLKDNAEFSKSYLVKRYLHWTEDELVKNREGFKLDKKYFPSDEVIDNLDTYGGADLLPGSLTMQMKTLDQQEETMNQQGEAMNQQQNMEQPEMFEEG